MWTIADGGFCISDGRRNGAPYMVKYFGYGTSPDGDGLPKAAPTL